MKWLWCLAVAVAGLVWYVGRRTCPGCPEGRSTCYVACDPVGDELMRVEARLAASPVELLAEVDDIGEALAFIDGTQHLHREPLQYRCLVEPTRVEIFKVVTP